MPRTTIPIADGFYEEDSLPISAQNCVNLYPVIEDASVLTAETLRGSPGVEWIAVDGILGTTYDPDTITPPDGGDVPGGVPGVDVGGGDDPEAGGTDIGGETDVPLNEDGENVIPECLPYDCESFGHYVAEVYAGDVASLNTSFDTATTAANLGDTKALIDDTPAGDGYTLSINKQSAADSANSFQVSSVPVGSLDPCVSGAFDNALKIIKTSVASQGELTISGAVDGNLDVVVVARSRRASPYNSLSDTGSGNTQCIGKTITVNFTYNGVNDTSQAFNQTLYVEDDVSAKTATFKVQINGQRTGSTTTGSQILDIGTINLDPDTDAWYNWSLIQFQVKDFTLEAVTDWVNGSRQRVKLTRTFVCKVAYIGTDGEPNILDVSETYETYSSAFGGSGITDIAVEPNLTGIPVFATKSDVIVAGLYVAEAPIDLEDLFLRYRRNLSTYTPPDYC